MVREENTDAVERAGIKPRAASLTEYFGGNMRPKFYLGCMTTHILGNHYAPIMLAGKCVYEFNFGKDYANAVLFVREINKTGSL